MLNFRLIVILGFLHCFMPAAQAAGELATHEDKIKAPNQLVSRRPARVVSADQFVCQPTKLRGARVSYFQKGGSTLVWAAVSQSSDNFYSYLGLNRIKPSIKISAVRNFAPCGSGSEFYKIFTTANRQLSAAVKNSCEERLATELGLIASKGVNNYGSMEPDNQFAWSELNICTDGSKLFNCDQPSAIMLNCLRRL